MAKVLIIEDETSLLDVYSEYLQSEGHDVIKAVDGDAGLEAGRTADWEIMFLDIMLPKLDGIELLKTLNNEGILKKRPVIMLSNLEMDPIVVECMKVGAVGYLSKAKTTPQSLLDEINKWLTKNEDGNKTEKNDVEGDVTSDDEEMNKLVKEAFAKPDDS